MQNDENWALTWELDIAKDEHAIEIYAQDKEDAVDQYDNFKTIIKKYWEQRLKAFRAEEALDEAKKDIETLTSELAEAKKELVETRGWKEQCLGWIALSKGSKEEEKVVVEEPKRKRFFGIEK